MSSSSSLSFKTSSTITKSFKNVQSNKNNKSVLLQSMSKLDLTFKKSSTENVEKVQIVKKASTPPLQCHSFMIVCPAKIRSNKHQLLNVACLCLYTVNRVRSGLEERMLRECRKKHQALQLLVSNNHVSPDTFISASFSIVVKKKNVDILLNNEFFEDLGNLLLQSKFSRESVKLILNLRFLAQEKLKDCVKIDINTTTHVHISFNVDFEFANEFVAHDCQHTIIHSDPF